MTTFCNIFATFCYILLTRRDAPQPLDEPPGRFSLAQAALNPGHTLKLVLGPDLTREARAGEEWWGDPFNGEQEGVASVASG